MRPFITFYLAISLLSGCATGVRYSEDLSAHVALPPELARITILRTRENAQYVIRSAPLRLDGKSIGDLNFGGYLIVNTSAGTHTLQVELGDIPGRCEVTFQATEGAIAYFEVLPRWENMIAATPGVLVPGVTPSSLLFGNTVALAGMAIESAEKQCGGAFAIIHIEPVTALAKLADLRRSQ